MIAESSSHQLRGRGLHCEVAVALVLVGVLISACGSNSNTVQAGPNDRTACHALDVIYANNGADPSDSSQGQILSTYGLKAENHQLRADTYLLVADSRDNNAKAVRTELGIAAGICQTMGIGPSQR